MSQPACEGKTEQEHGDVTRFEVSLFDEGVAHFAGVGHEAIHFRLLLRRALHDLHAVERLGEMCVHLPEGGARRIGDGRQRLEIARQRGEINHGE